MGILMGMVTMITSIRYPTGAKSRLLRTKPLKSSHYSSTHLHQSVHLLDMESNAVLVLAPLRSPHASAIPCRPVQLSSQLHNPWLLPHRLACLPLLTGDHPRLPSAAQPVLGPDTTRFTLPLEIWTTSQRPTAALLPHIHWKDPYHPTSTPMDMPTIMNMAMTLSSMPIP